MKEKLQELQTKFREELETSQAQDLEQLEKDFLGKK
jgi:uncharacterized protein YeaO (DUF488 family)